MKCKECKSDGFHKMDCSRSYKSVYEPVNPPRKQTGLDKLTSDIRKYTGPVSKSDLGDPCPDCELYGGHICLVHKTGWKSDGQMAGGEPDTR